MKTPTFILIILMLLIHPFGYETLAASGDGSSASDGALTLICSPDLAPLANAWAAGFGKSNPDVSMDLIRMNESGPAASLKNYPGGIVLLSSSQAALLEPPAPWSVVVGRNVTVAIMNSSHPMAGDIARRGITQLQWASFFSDPGNRNWSTLTGLQGNQAMHYLSLADQALQQEVRNFSQAAQFNFDGRTVASGRELVTSVASDPLAMGFCRLVDLSAPEMQELAGRVKIIPIDRNGNGRIDMMEDIYDNAEDFSRGVWIGKYPKSLTDQIFAVSMAQPGQQAATAFVEWVLNDGQRLLATLGYGCLVAGENQTQLDKLIPAPVRTASPGRDSWAVIRIILMVVLGFILAGFILDIMGRYFRSLRATTPQPEPGNAFSFDEATLSAPKGLYFDKTHTWAFMERDGVVKVGVDDFLPHITGPIQRVELKTAGERVKKGELLLTLVHKGMRLNVLSPVTGTIRSRNGVLESRSFLINQAPYSDGWVYTIEPLNWTLEVQFLTMAEKYLLWVKEEFNRLRDFVALHLQAHSPERIPVTLQDGGLVREGILAELGPEAWEEFQKKFMEPAR